MRKVKKCDEIPLKLLTDCPTEIRKKAEIKPSSARKIAKKIRKLENWLNTQVGTDAETDTIMARFYDYVDMYMAEAVNPHLVCAKGCAHCCKISVEVTALEASYIHSKTEFKAEPLTISSFEIVDSFTEYCNLLDQETGLCKIYEYRPLACRIFGTYDHYRFCESPDVNHAIHSFGSHPFLRVLGGNLMTWSESSPYAAHADIRDWFTGNKK